jgi:hypothetical protein
MSEFVNDINLQIENYFKKNNKLPKIIKYKNKNYKFSHFIYFMDSKWSNMWFIKKLNKKLNKNL